MPNRTQIPTPKVTSAAVAGALTVVLVWLIGYAGVEVPAEVASAVTLLLSVGVAYLIPDKSTIIPDGDGKYRADPNARAHPDGTHGD